MGLLQEFKEFAVKGNVIDMAVGIVLGVAFNKIVTSLVNDVIMPPIGMIIGNVPFKDLRVVLKEGTIAPGTTELAGEVAIRYGALVNTVIEFVIVAFSVFMVVKVMNTLIKKRQAEAAK
ncbi:MAG: large-conductance mechanosensitive channel protein MscL [Phycisphaeraceae bacterium]